MAKGGVNKVILVGNLGQDPEVRYMPNGNAVTNVSLATTEGWKDKQTGEQQERTEWHRLVFFNRLGEIAGQYLRKGSKLYIEGSIRTNKWQDKNGADRYTTEIIVSDLHMLDSKGGSGTASFSGGQQAPANTQQQAAAPAAPSAAQAPAAPAGIDDFDDDVPF